jgi:hypothetical protein
MQQETEAPRGKFVCSMCDASFDTQEELDRHVAEVHTDEEAQKES